MITNMPPGTPAPVYDIAYWHSDNWNQYAHARDYDFSRPFFAQFSELIALQPRASLLRGYEFDENSDYTNHAGNNKNCYLIIDSDGCRDCLYSYSISACVDCIDCFRCDRSELCYECVDCVECYQSRYLQNCSTCVECVFMRSCIGCTSCYGCVNLKNKRYCWYNQQLSEHEYKTRLQAIGLDSRESVAQLKQQYAEFARQHPARFVQGFHNEDVLGDYLLHCKNAHHCFDSRKLWDCSYLFQAFAETKDSMDCTEVGESELLYETCYAGVPGYNLRFCAIAYPNVQNLTYCYAMKFSSNCFGCAGLRRAEFCILNKRYSEQDYFDLLPRIIAHMQSTGEWGEFFPAALAPVPYNLSHAFDFLPLTQEQALARGYRWWSGSVEEPGAVVLAPDRIADANVQICEKVLCCAETGKKFRLQKSEFQFYQKLGIPVPATHWECRHLARLRARNPREFHVRRCAACSQELLSTVPEARNSQVLCEVDFQRVLE